MLNYRKKILVAVDGSAVSDKIDWQFKTADARIKLKHLYPKL
jgi:uncharacterized protein (DUF952 family)